MMRAYPFGLIFHEDIDKAEHWAVEHSKLTHRDPIALAACTAVGVGVAQVLRDEEVMTVTLAMVKAARRYCPKTANIIERAVDDAWSWPRRSVDLRSCVFPSVMVASRKRWLRLFNSWKMSFRVSKEAGGYSCTVTGVWGVPAPWRPASGWP